MVIFFDTFSFWQTFEPNLRNTFPIGQIFIVVNVQILKNYIVIWSHWLCYMRAYLIKPWSSFNNFQVYMKALTASYIIWKLWQLLILLDSCDSCLLYIKVVAASPIISERCSIQRVHLRALFTHFKTNTKNHRHL